MHDTSKLGSFMALRANGWSLAKISRELNISKSTLWEWDNKQQNEIHLLKHLQLEKLQEKYLPTYEEELSKLRSYLDRLEVALENQDFTKMGPEYVLQMALQLRARLGKMREQVPLRNVPFNQPLAPLPFTGCVSRQGSHKFRDEFFEGDPEPVAAPRESGAASETSVAPPPKDADLPVTDNGSHTTDTTPDPLRELRASVVNPENENQNRTFPDETPPGSKNEPLKINGFHKPDLNGRPVFNSENGNSHSHKNGHPHSNGNGAINPHNDEDDGWESTPFVHENGVPIRFRKKNP